MDRQLVKNNVYCYSILANTLMYSCRYISFSSKRLLVTNVLYNLSFCCHIIPVYNYIFLVSHSMCFMSKIHFIFSSFFYTSTSLVWSHFNIIVLEMHSFFWRKYIYRLVDKNIINLIFYLLFTIIYLFVLY